MDEAERAAYRLRRRQADNSPSVRRRLYGAVFAPDPLICALCWQRIDKRLPRGHRWSKTVDHIIEIIDGGSGTDPANLQPAHLHCNVDKEARRKAARAVDRREMRPRQMQPTRPPRRTTDPIVGGTP